MKIVFGAVLAIIGLLIVIGRKRPAMFVGAVLLAAGGYLVFMGIRARRLESVMNEFIAAAGRGDLATVRRLADEQPLFINSIQRSSGVIVDRPLHAAAKGLHPDVVAFLIKRGAIVDADLEDGSTALHAAGEQGFIDDEQSLRREAVINALVDRGAPVNAKDFRQETPLMANAEDPRAIAVLLRHGAEVKARDSYGRTPLHYAVMTHGDHSAAITLLLEHGAEVDARDRHNQTPLLVATMNPADIATLLAHGADAKARDDQGRNALHLAARSPDNLRSDIEMLGVLCSCGLDPDSRDTTGATPLGIARERLAKESDRIWVDGRRRIVGFLDVNGPCRRLAGATREQRDFAVAEFLCRDHDQHSCGVVAWDYDEGKGVAADPARAAALYEPLCDGGAMFACNNLGLMFEEGRGVAKNASRARELFRRACDGGDKNACEHIQEKAE